MNWDDLNYPARMTTLAAAGLPWLLRANLGSTVAVQNLARRLDVGILAESMEETAGQHGAAAPAVHLQPPRGPPGGVLSTVRDRGGRTFPRMKTLLIQSSLDSLREHDLH
jgi:hypothetical protein